MQLRALVASKSEGTGQNVPGGIIIKQVAKLEELKSYCQQWDRLLLELSLPIPMLSCVWVLSALEHFVCPGDEWVCLMAYDGGILVGILPLIIGRGNFRAIPYGGLRTPFNWHMLACNCLIRPGYEGRIIPPMLQSARKISPLYSGLKLFRMESDSPIIDILKQGIIGYKSVSIHNGCGSYIKISGSYEKYLEGLDTKFVRNLRRLDRKMQSLANLEYSVVTENAGEEGYFERFLKVEGRSWKGKKGTAIMHSGSLKKYYSDLTQRLAEHGWLEWYFLSAEGKTIAAMMTIRIGRRLVIYKIGYDEDYASYSPGNKLFEKMLHKVHTAGGIDEVDCLTAYPWNQNWNMATRDYYDLTIYPKRPAVLLGGYLPAKISNSFGHGSYLRKRCRMLLDSAVKFAGGLKRRPLMSSNGTNH